MTEKDQREEKHAARPGDRRTKKRRGRAGKALLLILRLALIAALVWLTLHFVLGVTLVHSNDMYPAVRDGDLLITYKQRPYSYGELIAYEHEGRRHVGRIVALPGDVVEIDGEGSCRVNGGVPYETVYYKTKLPETSPILYPYTVPEDGLFVLNDMRESMTDSRSFGAIAETDAQGSAALLLRRRSW